MKERTTAGSIIALVGAVVGIIGVFVVFMLAYGPMIAVEIGAGRPDEADIVKYVIPFLSDLGIVAGVLWAVSAEDGSKIQEMKLDVLPVFDGMIAAGGRLLMSTVDGKVVCFASE